MLCNDFLTKHLTNKMVKNLYLDSMFHAMWMGDALESHRDYLLGAFYFGCICLSDFYGLFLYSKISGKSTTEQKRLRPAGFSDLMNMAPGFTGIKVNQQMKASITYKVLFQFLLGTFTTHSKLF